MRGISEQYRQAKHFLQLARKCKNTTSQFTNLITAIYPARAVVELMFEAAEKQELVPFNNKDNKVSRNELEAKIVPKLPYYYLIEKVRIHDFHRFGCLPPSLEYEKLFIGGPIKLIAKKDNSSVKEQRSLYANNGLYYDEDNKKYVSLEKILADYLGAVPEVITEFKSYYKSK